MNQQRKADFMLKKMIVNMKGKDHHIEQYRKVTTQYHNQLDKKAKNDEDVYNVQNDDSQNEQESSRTQEVAQDHQQDEQLDNVLGTINMKMSKKTQKQKEAESEALQAFLLECEKRNILTKEILKNLNN